ncbi:MAG: HAD hydrolase-like protein [Gammaproteobacteria bacterium]|nr:HAD hydrolase-like protein [Gammaproteobacteria bacterium]
MKYALESLIGSEAIISKETVFFFDMDGTLIDTDYSNYLSYRQAVLDVTNGAIDIPFDPNRRLNRTALEKMFPHLCVDEIEKISTLKAEYYRRHLPKTKLNVDLVDVLANFKDRNRFILVTNCQEGRVVMTLKYHNLLQHFESIFPRYRESGADRNKFVDAIESIRAKPECILVFENEETEIEKAIFAGIPRQNILNVANWR